MSESEKDSIDSLKDSKLRDHFQAFGSALPSNFAWLVSQTIVRERLIRAKSIARLQALSIAVGLLVGGLLLFLAIGAYLGTSILISLDRYLFAGIAVLGVAAVITLDDLIDVKR